jgi:O-antigen ligase
MRVKGFLTEYQDYKHGANPSGKTMLMRFEFWKAAIYIIKRNVWFGVGTGDAQAAFHKAYYRTGTKLSHEWRLRSHNQFLAITVSFGMFGLALFIFSLVYPAFVVRNKLSGLYFIFLFIVVISFMTEDTLESQSGVSFFAYFNNLVLWMGNSNAFGDPSRK